MPAYAKLAFAKQWGLRVGDIRLQFLAEAAIISLVGGVIGTLVGVAMPLSVRYFTDYSVPISIWSVVIGLTAATLVGVIFGTYPASRAARMIPWRHSNMSSPNDYAAARDPDSQ